jgi:hypothetical protein
MVKSKTEVADVTAEIEAAAYDFARHTKGGGGWALGLSVAACVQPGAGQGGGQPRNDRYKVSAQEFAKLAGTSAPRIMRYLEAWDRAAAKNVVPAADTLKPEDWYDADCLPTGYEWSEFYDASGSGSRPRDSKPEHAAQIIEKRGAAAVVAEMTPEQQQEVAKALPAKVIVQTVRDPKIASAVTKDPQAGAAVIKSANEQFQNRAKGSPNAQNGNSSGIVSALQQMLQQIGALAYEHTGQQLEDALTARHHQDLPWRPGEMEAIIAKVEEGIQHGLNCKALLEGIDDEDLAELLG